MGDHSALDMAFVKGCVGIIIPASTKLGCMCEGVARWCYWPVIVQADIYTIPNYSNSNNNKIRIIMIAITEPTSYRQLIICNILTRYTHYQYNIAIIYYNSLQGLVKLRCLC
jgi:hypothetical protein